MHYLKLILHDLNVEKMFFQLKNAVWIAKLDKELKISDVLVLNFE